MDIFYDYLTLTFKVMDCKTEREKVRKRVKIKPLESKIQNTKTKRHYQEDK